MDKPATKEFFQVGSMYDPSGTGTVGTASGVNFTKTAYGQPIIFFKGPAQDLFLTMEVYRQEGAPDWVHLKCPRCGNALKISADKKHLDYERTKVPRFPDFKLDEVMSGLDLPHHGGTLNVEPFRCDWPFDGFVCGFTAAIDNNIMRTA